MGYATAPASGHGRRCGRTGWRARRRSSFNMQADAGKRQPRPSAGPLEPARKPPRVGLFVAFERYRTVGATAGANAKHALQRLPLRQGPAPVAAIRATRPVIQGRAHAALMPATVLTGNLPRHACHPCLHATRRVSETGPEANFIPKIIFL